VRPESETGSRSRTGRLVAVAIVIAVGIAALSISGDLSGIDDRLRDFAWWTFAAACGFSIANYAIRFVRWEVYLRMQSIAIPRASSAGVFVAGLSLAITPGKLGELVKSYFLRRLHDVPVTRSAPIVIAERVTDLIALIVLSVIGVAIYGIAVGVTVAAAAVVAAGLVILAWPRVAHAIIEVVTRPRITRRFRERLIEIYDGLASLCRPLRLLAATAIGGIGWLGECAGFALVVHGLPGASIDVGLATLIYAATTIAGALSFLPGGLGVTEGAMILLLVQSADGLDTAGAVAASVIIRVATLWLGVAIGLAGVVWVRRRIAARDGHDPGGGGSVPGGGGNMPGGGGAGGG
jgi:uncharacterized protein (TIRG00374 family)